MLAHIVVFTSELDAAERFYANAFGLQTAWKKTGDKAYLTSGRGDALGILQDAKQIPITKLSITDFLDTHGNTEKFPHFGFTFNSEDEYTAQLSRLEALHIPCSEEHVSRDGSRSCFLFDLDKNAIQIVLLGQDYFFCKRGMI
jgi:catechol 2,3-dioxygenase-like lactoylglutathione lyase family enzyme